MSVLKNPAWWLLLLLFGLHQIGERLLEWDVPVLDNYFDAFVSVPILLGLHLAEQRYFFGVERFSWLYVGVAVLLFTLVFEGLFPRWQPLFTADRWDVAAYILGGAYFYFLINTKRTQKKEE